LTTASSELRVALVCLDPWQLGDSADIRPFSYGVRRIQAAILGHPALAGTSVTMLESSSLDAEAMAARIEVVDPHVVGVSAYVWSFPALLDICRLVKRRNPELTVIFGGPSSRPEMCRLPQHSDSAEVIDALVVGEGEQCIQDILLASDRARSTLRTIPGLAVHDGKAWQHTGPVSTDAPDRHPSAYALGLIPSDVTLELETFRGCPLSCSFCQWGDMASGRIFGFDYLLAELQAMDRLDGKGVWLVDAGLNLNAKAFRNLQRAEAEVGVLERIGGFRCEIYPSKMTDDHLRFLEDTTALYAGIGLQATDPEVLKSVSRKFDESRFARVVSEVGSIVPEATVELMMGLPGDNPDNFKRTVERIRRLPINVRVFHTLVLPDALMKRAPADFDLVYDPYDLRVLSAKGWSRKEIDETRAWLDDQVSDAADEPPNTWRFFRSDRADQDGRIGRFAHGHAPVVELTSAPPDVRKSGRDVSVLPGMRAAVDREAGAAGWTVQNVRAVDGDVEKGVLVEAVHQLAGSLVLRAVRQEPDTRCYRDRDGIAYSYERAGDMDKHRMSAFDQLMDQLHPLLRATVLGLRKETPAVQSEASASSRLTVLDRPHAK